MGNFASICIGVSYISSSCAMIKVKSSRCIDFLYRANLSTLTEWYFYCYLSFEKLTSVQLVDGFWFHLIQGSVVLSIVPSISIVGIVVVVVYKTAQDYINAFTPVNGTTLATSK